VEELNRAANSNDEEQVGSDKTSNDPDYYP
jgi:hypothetical protein